MCVTWLPPDGGWDPMVPGGPVLIDHLPDWSIDDVPQETDQPKEAACPKSK